MDLGKEHGAGSGCSEKIRFDYPLNLEPVG